MSKDTLSDRIRTARTTAGLSQRDLANQIYSSQQAISRLETGHSDPRFDTIRAIAKTTQHPLTYFDSES